MSRTGRLFSRRRPAIPYGHVGALRSPILRTRAIRLGVAIAALLILVAAAATARSSAQTRSSIVPKGTKSVVVVDLSKSIIDSEFQPIAATLRRLIATNTPTGLVVFSDVSYELLPAGTPAKALVPLLRFFTPGRGGYPTNPWQANFRAGTRISSALDLADQMLTGDGITNGSIVLISDLETASSDAAALSDTLSRLREEKVQLRVVPLRPSDQALKLFNSLLPKGYLIAKPNAVTFEPTQSGSALDKGLPVLLVVLGALLLLALAANERWCGRLGIEGSS